MPSPVGEEGVIDLREYKSHATNNHSNIVRGHGQEDMPTSVAKRVGEEPEEGSLEYIRRKYFPVCSCLRSVSRVAHLCTPALRLFRYHTAPLWLNWHSYPNFGLSPSPHLPWVASSCRRLSCWLYTGWASLFDPEQCQCAEKHSIRGLWKGEFEIPAAPVRKHISEDALGQRPNGEKEEVRSRILAAGLKAMSEQGSLSFIGRGVDIVWASLVFWDQYSPSPSPSTVLKLVTSDIFLSQISTLLRQRVLTALTHNQLMGILGYFTDSGASVCTKVLATRDLIQPQISTINLNPAALALLRTRFLVSWKC